MSVAPFELYKPAVLHQPHPDSRLSQNYHWVPYPLGLMPYDSWHRLHNRDSVVPLLPFRCPVCRQERRATTHMRKVFLVAERLSWDDRMVSRPEQELNEELNWKVNYELGILDPFVEDPERPPGGKHSRHNRFHPYQNEHEMKLAMKLIFTTEDITEATWALWISAQLNLQSLTLQPEKPDTQTGAVASSSNKTEPTTAMADKSRPRTPDAIKTVDLTESPEPPSKPVHGRLQGVAATPHSLTNLGQIPTTLSRVSTGAAYYNSTPGSDGIGQAVLTERAPLMIEPDRRIRSYKSLQDFYSLLDKIERTSYVSAVFLEAYAEKLRDDMCKNCWLRHNINFDLF